jgi:hypothetical protein
MFVLVSAFENCGGFFLPMLAKVSTMFVLVSAFENCGGFFLPRLTYEFPGSVTLNLTTTELVVVDMYEANTLIDKDTFSDSKIESNN